MSDIYKLQYDGMTLTYPGWNGYVSYEAQSFKTLTLLNSEGGTLTANTLTGYPGDTISLSTAYNTYWRFSGYQLTGDGSLVGNDYTFGTEDATICACYKPNAFTATGVWDKGSNITISVRGRNTKTTAFRKYAIHNSHTGDIPSTWYSTTNHWNPSNASAYSITLVSKCTLTGKCEHGNGEAGGGVKLTATTLVGTTQNQTQTYSTTGQGSLVYNKTITTTTQNDYSISGALSARGRHKSTTVDYGSTATYIATGTNGTWTATGYAP